LTARPLGTATCTCIHTYLFTYSLHAAEPFLRSYPVCRYSRKSLHFMEPESSIPHSQMPATCLYPKPAQSSPYPHVVVCILVEMYGKFLGTRRHGIRFLFIILYRFVAVKNQRHSRGKHSSSVITFNSWYRYAPHRTFRLETDGIYNGGPIILVL
jgi:hypothetical protein